MAEFSFTMSNGSSFTWDALDPEVEVFGIDDSEEMCCAEDDLLVEAIDKLLNR